jgi:hypothetical protein
VAAAVGGDVDAHDVSVVAGKRVALDLELSGRHVRPIDGREEVGVDGHRAEREPRTAQARVGVVVGAQQAVGVGLKEVLRGRLAGADPRQPLDVRAPM